MAEDLAARFMRLFAGLDRAHGEYIVPPHSKSNGKGKIEGERRTVHAPPTLELWQKHLTSDSYGLGIVPIRDDGTVWWGNIDVDVYPLDLVKLWMQVAEMGLPLVLCRTKSGGAHLFLFCAEPTPAKLVRGKLLDWALALGYPGVEVFPKQTQLASDKDFGNWLNMPYQFGAQTTRYAIDKEGHALSPEAFLDVAARYSPTIAQINAVTLPDDEWFADGPPCLQVLAKRGFPSGTRNNALFNITLYARKAYGDDNYEDRLREINDKLLTPPKEPAEVTAIVNSVAKKNYNYKCKDLPISAVCNRQVCLTRQFGVGGAGDDPGAMFGSLLKLTTAPPTWIWLINEQRVELTTEQLQSQRLLQCRVMEVLTCVLTPIRDKAYRDILARALRDAEIVYVPDDATQEGQLMVQLNRFCTGRSQGRALDELLLGKPFTDVKQQRTYFCAADFLAWLRQHGQQGVTEKKLYTWLRQKDAQYFPDKRLKGKAVTYWSIPAFTVQSEEFDTPRKPPEEAM